MPAGMIWNGTKALSNWTTSISYRIDVESHGCPYRGSASHTEENSVRHRIYNAIPDWPPNMECLILEDDYSPFEYKVSHRRPGLTGSGNKAGFFTSFRIHTILPQVTQTKRRKMTRTGRRSLKITEAQWPTASRAASPSSPATA